MPGAQAIQGDLKRNLLLRVDNSSAYSTPVFLLIYFFPKHQTLFFLCSLPAFPITLLNVLSFLFFYSPSHLFLTVAFNCWGVELKSSSE